MADFNSFYPLLQQNEGGYQDSPTDVMGNTNSRGEMVGTNYGISARAYEAYTGHPPTQQEMRDMPPDTARDILHNTYWGMVRGDEINNQQAANMIADWSVTSGHTAIHAAQERMWLDGFHVDPQRDNPQLSQQAVDALNGMSQPQMQQFLQTYSSDRQQFYEHLAQDPAHAQSLHGWESRATMPGMEGGVTPTADSPNFGFNVHNIQSVLFADTPSSVDGKAGPATQHALQHWQESNHLQPTGYFDQATHDLMNQSILQHEAAAAHAAGPAHAAASHAGVAHGGVDPGTGGGI